MQLHVFTLCQVKNRVSRRYVETWSELFSSFYTVRLNSKAPIQPHAISSQPPNLPLILYPENG